VIENLAVVLVAPRNPLNIGAAARAMSNFGFTDLRLVQAYDVAFREAKSAVKSGYILERAREFATVGEAVADCSLVGGTASLDSRVLEHQVKRLEHGGRLLRRHLAGGRAALLFGSEKYGLSNEDMAHCHWLMRIPTRDEHGSMNLGQAVAVCLYELIRWPAAAREKPGVRQAARAEDEERITGLLLDVLTRSGYVHARVAGSTELKTRRLVRRMNLSAHDAEVWQGMLRQIRWKLSECYPESE
jgi:TrmH family RNA methyltransferase